MAFELESFTHDPVAIALEHAHNVAFHTGLGGHRLAVTNKYVSRLGLSPFSETGPSGGTLTLPADHANNQSVPAYAKQVYQKGNIAVVASGASQTNLEKWTCEFFAEVPAGTGVKSAASKYFGGENRVYNASGNALVIAYPGSQGGPSFKAEFSVLAYLLGGENAVKWNPGTSVLSQAVIPFPGVKAVARHAAYSDAGLLTITISGAQNQLAKASEEVVKAIHSLVNVKPEDVKRAIAQAKFDVLAAAEDRSVGLELVGQSVIAGGKAPQVEDVVKALEGVSVESVKSVSTQCIAALVTANLDMRRLRRLLLTVKLLSRRLVICTSCPSHRILV
jgi:ubiquinol-cytochrome c reductase core subunit 2